MRAICLYSFATLDYSKKKKNTILTYWAKKAFSEQKVHIHTFTERHVSKLTSLI